MKLSTCSFAGWRPGMGQPVRITLGSPRQPEPTGRAVWLYVAELAPAGWYFRAEAEKFGRCYESQLARHAEAIETKLGILADQFGPLTLCCYERRVRGPEDCHRRRAAAFLTDLLEIDIPEHDGRRTP